MTHHSIRGVLPQAFTENIRGVCGARGDEWLRELPDVVARLQARWNLVVEPCFPDLSFNYVAPATRKDGTRVVLKIGLPTDDNEIISEAAYLRLAGGSGAVKLLDEDPALRALLLQRAFPGENLRRVFRTSPDGAVDVVAFIVKKLIRRSPVESGEFFYLNDWTAKLHEAGRYPFPPRPVQQALATFVESGDDDKYLLHGDLHHANILSDENAGFLAIDPKGLIGDLRYDLGVFLNNHRGWLRDDPDLLLHLKTAVGKFSAAFGYSDVEIRRWAFAQKVLAAYWTMTDGGSRWREQLAAADVWHL